MYMKLRWLNRHFPDHEVSAELKSLKSFHAFNQFEEEGDVEQRHNNFTLIDLTREELYTTGESAIATGNEL